LNTFKFISIGFAVMLALTSCTNQTGQDQQAIDRKQIDAALLEANKQALSVENSQIEDYIRRNDLKMQKTGTGLRYFISELGSGNKAEEGKVVVLEYSVQLINGDLIYTSDEYGIKEFMIGKGGVEAGLEDGILLMHEGGRAKFIIPSHLAFGLTGDGNKVPPMSTLIYDVKLLRIKR
jgi:FKBP-type peptidyl-prolyl cis-trans isomerase